MRKRSDYIKYHASCNVENGLGGAKTISRVNNLSSVFSISGKSLDGMAGRGGGL